MGPPLDRPPPATSWLTVAAGERLPQQRVRLTTHRCTAATIQQAKRADAAAREGIAVTPASAFAVGKAPNAVRLALASPPLGRLGAALDVLAGIARSAPDLDA